MKANEIKIQYRDREYALVFNLNVMERIQEEYGSVDEWGSITDGKSGEPDAKAVIFGFTEMLNEGLEIEAEEKGIEFKPLTKKQVGRLITEYGLTNAVQKLNTAVIESVKTEEKNE